MIALHVFPENEWVACKSLSVRFDNMHTTIQKGAEVGLLRDKETLVYFKVLDITSGTVTIKVTVLLSRTILPCTFSLPENILKEFILEMCDTSSKKEG